jgi:IS30 family transposase
MSYTHLTSMERAKIEVLHQQGKSKSAIGRELGRDRTTIGRELRRNGLTAGYCAQRAQTRYKRRREACGPKGKLAHEALREYVVNAIALEDMSPELVAGRLKVDYPDDPKMRVCHETIYQAIYTNRHYLDFLMESLTQARPKRRKRGQGKTRRGPSIRNRVGIAERPTAVDERIEVGHFEGDLIVGKGQDGFIVTLVERVSRLLHAVKTSTKRASEVGQAVIDALIDRPVSWVKTITFDNGTEFGDHATIAEQLGVAVYFADPYSAYQRGSNEQVNGLIRRYLRKGTSFRDLTSQQVETITSKINNRPRKCLGYRTPNEVFQNQRQQHRRALRT